MIEALHEIPWDDLDGSIETRADWLVRFRRQLHKMPEPSGAEQGTTAVIADALRDTGLEPRIMADDTGIVVDIDLGAPGKSVVALRAELDCVQVNDDKQVPYASSQPGLCHACGHEVHATILLGATQCLTNHLDAIRHTPFRHNLRMLFQPAEESATGAQSMIQQGAIDDVEAIIALHVNPFLDVGKISIRNGPMTSACKSFRITVNGRSGHTARPAEAIDPIPAAVNIASMLYQLCPRSMDSRHPLALSVASITAGASFNAIPDDAILTGTLRAARIVDLENVQQRMDSVCRGVSQATDCQVSLEFLGSAPATANDPVVVDALAECATHLLGADGLKWLPVASMGAEDFAYFQEIVPGAFVQLGAGLEDKAARRALHSSLFDLNEDSLSIGAKFMTRAGLQLAAGYNNSGTQTG
jgi:amidohydrolase